MKRYTKTEVVEALRKEAKKWELRAERLIDFDALDMGLSPEEVEERNREYEQAREWQNCLAAVAFEIEHTDILK